MANPIRPPCDPDHVWVRNPSFDLLDPSFGEEWVETAIDEVYDDDEVYAGAYGVSATAGRSKWKVIGIVCAVATVIGLVCAILWWPADNPVANGKDTVIDPTTTVRGAGNVRRMRLEGVDMVDGRELQLLPQAHYHSGQWFRGVRGAPLFEQGTVEVGFRRALDGTMAVVIHDCAAGADQVEVTENSVVVSGLNNLNHQGTFVPGDFDLNGTVNNVVVDLGVKSSDPATPSMGPTVTINTWEPALVRVVRDQSDLVVYLLTADANALTQAVVLAAAQDLVELNVPDDLAPMTALDIQNTGRYSELVLAKWKPEFKKSEVGAIRDRTIHTLAVIGVQSLGNPDYNGPDGARGLFGFTPLFLEQAIRTGKYQVRIEDCPRCNNQAGQAEELCAIVQGRPDVAVDAGVELWKLLQVQGEALEETDAAVFNANSEVWVPYGLIYGFDAMVEAIQSPTFSMTADPKMGEYFAWVTQMEMWADSYLSEDLVTQAYTDDAEAARKRAVEAVRSAASDPE